MFAAGDVLGKLEAFRAGLASGDAKRRAAPPKPGKGDRVTAKIAGWKQPYKGTVESVDKDTRACRVIFDDGEVVDAVHFDEILAVDSKGNVKDGAESPSLGDYVSARVAGWKKPYSGTVTKVVEEDEVFEITFDDGEVIDDVRLEEILEVLTRATPVKSKVGGSLQVGTRVQAQVSGWKKPYEGVITRVVQPDKVFEVTFDDGEVIEDVQVDEILQCLSEDKLLAQGTRVMAKLKGWKQAYPGVIKVVKNGAYKIVFDDGEVQEGVEPSTIEDVLENQEEDGDDVENDDLLAEGTRVTAKLKGWKQAYPGVIKVVRNGAYKIVFDDGEVQEGVEPSAVEDVLEEEKDELLDEGTRVTAKLKGWKQAYPGVIKAVMNGAYKIVFDDGEVQDNVEPSAIEDVLEEEEDDEGEGNEEEEVGDLHAEGTRVTAKLKGWKQAYSGVIKAVKNGAYKIVFDDGEVQDNVEPSAIEAVLKDDEEEEEEEGEVGDLLAEGTRVTAKLKGWKQAYPGVIKAVKNGNYKIVFDDGEVQEGVEPSAVEDVLKDEKKPSDLLAEGTRVTAKLKGWKQAYPGAIKAVKNGTYKIVFDDGEVQDNVEPSAIEGVLEREGEDEGEGNEEEEVGDLLAEGTRVMTKLKGWKQAYPGVIKAVKNGAYKIVFDDGEIQEGVEPSAIEDVLKDEEEAIDLLAEGTRVTAKLKGWKQAYPGVIKAVKNGAYKIVFDDGEIQEGVEPSAIEDVLKDEEEAIDLLAEGTRVTAKLKGWKQAYSGVIKAVKNGAYKIEFDDGEVCESVQPAEILVHEVEQASGSTDGDHAPGDRIRAKLQSWKEAYSGTICSVNGDGTLHVEFDDGEVIKCLPLCDLVNEPSPRRPTDLANDEDLLAFLNDEKELHELPADSSTPDNDLSQGGAQVAKPASASVKGNGTSQLEVVAKSKPADLEMATKSKESVTLNPAPGDTVMAKLPSWKTAYKGVVKRHNVQDGSFKVIFDDGEVVNAVPKSAITEIVTKKMASSDASNQSSFSAPDGKTFHDRAEYKRYMYETYYCFKQAEGNHTTLVKVPGSVDGQPFDLASLSDCTVRVLCWSSQVQVDKVMKSKVFIGPCESSIFIRDCRDCEFTLACRQLRLRDCENCTFNLFSNVDPVIETSTNLVFRPFNGAYAGLREHFAKAKLDPADNHWRQIFDFNKDGCDGYGIPDPHYRLEEAKSNKLVWEWVESDFEGPGDCVNPVAPDAVATTQSDGGATHQGQFTEAGAAAGRTEEGPCFVWASEIPRDELTTGMCVSVNFNRDSKKPRASDFYQGKIQACNRDGTFVVAYDDGDVENDCKIDFIKVAQTTMAPVTSGLEDNKDAAADFPAVAAPQKNDQTSSYFKPSALECQDSKSKAATQAENTSAETAEPLSSCDAKIGVAASLDAAISSSNALNATFTWAKDVSDQLLMTGAVVRVNFNRGSQDPTDEDFYTGKIRRINDDGSFAIDYDDGDVEEDCKLDFVQLLTGHAESTSNRVQQETPKSNDLAEMTIDASPLRKEKPVVLHQMMTFDAVERKNKKKGASSDVAPPQGRQKASSSSARIQYGGSLSLRQARNVDEAVQSESVLVNRNLHEEYVDLSALCKGVVNAVHSDETLEVELDNGETIDGVQLHQVHLLDGAIPTPRAARRTVQQRTRQDPEDNAFTLLRLELTKLREEQRVDQVRMRKERKAQEARILEQRRKQAESLAASRSQARQSVLIETMQREICAQREFQQQLMLQHQEAMEKLQHRLVDLTADTEEGLSPRLGNSKRVPFGRAEVGGKQLASIAELEAIRQEIQESRVALQQDMRAAASHAREMERLTRVKELERGWNAGRGRQAKSPKAPKTTPEVVTTLATEGIEAEVIADAMNELEEAKKQRADFLVAMKRRLRKQKSDARASQSNASLRMSAHRADTNRAVKLLYGLYEGYESERSGKVVRSPGPSEIVTPQWTQKVTELQLKPLNFRSRAHNNETWHEVGLALARIHVEGLGLAVNARCSAQQQAIPQLEKAWIDWTIASNKDLQEIRVSAALARKLGIIDSSLQARSGGGGDEDEDDVVFDGLLFTHRQCERRVLKHSRQEQRGDFARAHIVPDVPLDPEVRLQNSLYKKVCRDEWARFVQRVEAKDDYLNRTPDQASGPGSTKEALQLLQTWAKADHEAKQAEAARRAAERKAEAARDFEQWKQLKEKSRVKTRTLEQLRDAKAERKTPFPRPAGGPSDLAATFASERALPLRYAGNGRALEGEANTNYMHAAQRTSLPGSGPLVQALKANSAGSKGSVYAPRSHDPQNPWKNVASTEHELRQFDALLAAQEDAEKERAVQAQRDFLAWEDAVKVEKRVIDALKALDFESRCMRTSLNTSTPETRLGMDEWIFVGRALHALHHAQSRSLFQTWAEWTVQGVKSVLNKPLLTFARCTLEVIEGGATGLRLEPNVRLAEGAMLWITRSPVSRPGGKLTPEGLAVHVDRKCGDVAVVGAALASSTDKTTTSVVHCAWQRLTMVPGATVYVYPIPSLLGRVLFGGNSSGGGSLSARGVGPHAGRLRDSHQLSGHVRSICAEKWRTFTPNMRWFSDLLSEDDEDLLCGEVDKFRQLRQNERIRAKLLEIAGEHTLAAEIRDRMHVLWATVLQNPALASSTVLFQEIGGSPASMARIDSRGHEIDATDDDVPSIASVCKNDLVCLASQDKNVRSRWHKGAYWYRIVGLSMVKHSVVVVREPKIRSAGDGALAFRISLSGLHDDSDDVAIAVEDDLPVEETVHLSRLSGAILVRPQRGEVKEDAAFDMYLLPGAGVFARSMGAEMIARAEADAKTARCKEQEAEASSKMALQENGEKSYESFRNALLEQLAPASDEAVSQHFDFVGKSLARVASSWRRVGVVPRSIGPAVAAGAEETKDETECGASLDGGQCPWLQLWRSWVLSSQKWAELARLGFQLSDMHAMMDRKWAKFSDTSKHPGSRDPLGTSMLVLNDLRAQLESSQVAVTSATLSSSSS